MLLGKGCSQVAEEHSISFLPSVTVTHKETIDKLYFSCRLLGVWRTKVKVHFHNSRCLRKVINNRNVVAVYRLCIQGQSILQTWVRNASHILYKGEHRIQLIDNIFPSMCTMYWNKTYFNNIALGTVLYHALRYVAPKLFVAAGRKGAWVTPAVSRISGFRSMTADTSSLLYNVWPCLRKIIHCVRHSALVNPSLGWNAGTAHLEQDCTCRAWLAAAWWLFLLTLHWPKYMGVWKGDGEHQPP